MTISLRSFEAHEPEIEQNLSIKRLPVLFQLYFITFLSHVKGLMKGIVPQTKITNVCEAPT